MPVWKCNVCGYEIDTTEAPDPCPSCGSSSGEFYVKGHHPKDKLEVGADLLVINGSKHRAHNSAYFASLVEEVAKEKGVSCKVLHLADYKIEHCWCCYSMIEDQLRVPVPERVRRRAQAPAARHGRKSHRRGQPHQLERHASHSSRTSWTG